MQNYIEITTTQLALASLLILLNLGISFVLRLGLGSRLLLVAIRMTIQLLLVGFVLEWLFALNRPLPVLAAALVMALLAGVSAVSRSKRRFRGVYFSSLVSILVSAALVTGFGVVGILDVNPWFDPQYLIPLMGMILGNALTGITLALDRFLDGCKQNRGMIEMFLSHGATRWEAAHREVKEAVRTGTIPLLNSMAVMGIVSLPGMMTGQILAGAAPADAVRYQIVIMFMIASCTALATVGIVMMAFVSVFSRRHELLTERILG